MVTNLIDNMRHTLVYLETRVAELEEENINLRDQLERYKAKDSLRYRDESFPCDHLPSSNS
jgi:hypothetical protein